MLLHSVLEYSPKNPSRLTEPAQECSDTKPSMLIEALYTLYQSTHPQPPRLTKALPTLYQSTHSQTPLE